jgi:hypothetical protein
VKARSASFGGEGGAKNVGVLFLQSTIDIHILNMFRLTVDIHFQNTLLLPLSLLLCSLLLPNCEGSHSVRLFFEFIVAMHKLISRVACGDRMYSVTTVDTWVAIFSELRCQ